MVPRLSGWCEALSPPALLLTWRRAFLRLAHGTARLQSEASFERSGGRDERTMEGGRAYLSLPLSGVVVRPWSNADANRPFVLRLVRMQGRERERVGRGTGGVVGGEMGGEVSRWEEDGEGGGGMVGSVAALSFDSLAEAEEWRVKIAEEVAEVEGDVTYHMRAALAWGSQVRKGWLLLLFGEEARGGGDKASPPSLIHPPPL